MGDTTANTAANLGSNTNRREELRAVLLDVGGVLLVPDPIRVGEVTASHGGTDDTESLIRAHFGAICAADDGTALDWRRYDHELLVRAGVPEDRIDAGAEAVAAAYTRQNVWDHPLPDAATGLAALAKTGLRLGIVSNSDGTVEQTLRNVQMCQVGPGPGVPVEVLIDSEVVGVAKPDPAIFTFALDAMGLQAAEAIYVGDTRTFDVAGARAAGLHPVHVDPYSYCPQRDDHEHVTGVADLAARLDSAQSGQRELL
jgi:putative hydrolase of the HAD superfamily